MQQAQTTKSPQGGITETMTGAITETMNVVRTYHPKADHHALPQPITTKHSQLRSAPGQKYAVKLTTTSVSIPAINENASATGLPFQILNRCSSPGLAPTTLLCRVTPSSGPEPSTSTTSNPRRPVNIAVRERISPPVESCSP
jgi:hypothetical protein